MMRRKKKRFEIVPKYLLLALTIICVVLMILSLLFENLFAPVKDITNTVITPMQKGVNTIGQWVEHKVDALKNYDELQKENEALNEQLQTYQDQLQTYQQDSYELTRLQNLYNLDAQYADYEKTAARVISKDTGNWFDIFYISKGTSDGLAVGYNVLYGGGLCGIVTEAGEDYAKVRTIIDDTSNVSAMILPSETICNVAGSLTNYSEGYIIAENIDKDAAVDIGDEVVTSYVSDKYLQGITIGYVSDITYDSNNLTKTAYILPACDFSNIQEVLVILELKKSISE
jgi:rod shape-determining protein MreC